MKKIKIIAYTGPSGSKVYRVEQVAKYLNRTDKYEFIISPTSVTDEQLLWSDIILLQHTVDPKAIAMAWAYKVERGKKLITDFDDTLKPKADNPFHKRHKEVHSQDWLTQLAKISDLITVTTKTLKDEISVFNPNTHIVYNYLDMEKWDIPTTPNETDMIRVGWAGSMTHRNDLRMIMPVIRQILKERPQVKFAFCGDNIDFMFEGVNPMQWEQIQSTGNVYKYPYLAHTLMYDIAVAPLVDNHFNRAKSFLKWLEYSMTRSAGIFSPSAYKDVIKQGENGYLAYTKNDWYKYINLLVDDSLKRKQIAKRAYQDVSRNYSIEKNVWRWDKLYQELLNPPSLQNAVIPIRK